jgi:hypothetical protein
MLTNTKLGEIIGRAWIDPEFKQRLVLAPKAALAEMGFAFPDNVDVRVVENSADKVYLTLPVAPWSEAVRDEEMDPLMQAPTATACWKSYSACCAHPEVVQSHAEAATV